MVYEKFETITYATLYEAQLLQNSIQGISSPHSVIEKAKNLKESLKEVPVFLVHKMQDFKW